MLFDWDENKRQKVINDHNVDFEFIKDIFDDFNAIDGIDDSHSNASEIRFSIIGITAQYGLIFLIYTQSDEADIRFITAWKAENWMVDEYEKRKK